MPRKPKPKPDNPEQFKRFIEMAREVEVDKSPEALDRAFNKVIRPKEKPKKTKAPWFSCVPYDVADGVPPCHRSAGLTMRQGILVRTVRRF